MDLTPSNVSGLIKTIDEDDQNPEYKPHMQPLQIMEQDGNASDVSFYEIEGTSMPRESTISTIFSCEVTMNYNCPLGHLSQESSYQIGLTL